MSPELSLQLTFADLNMIKSGWFNSSPPSATYIRWWTGSALVQIMACRLDSAKPLSEPMLSYCQLHPKEHISMKFYFNSNIFIQENVSDHVVCEMAVIWPRGRWVNCLAWTSEMSTSGTHATALDFISEWCTMYWITGSLHTIPTVM